MQQDYFSQYAIRNLAGKSWTVYRLLFQLRDRLSPPRRIINRSRTHRNYYVVDTDPLIIITSEGIQDIVLMSEIIGARSAHFFVVFWWSQETPSRVRELFRHYSAHQQRYPNHKITFACNTKREFALLQEYDLPAVFVNQNCLLDESIYHVCPNVEKQFDAIYNARLVYSKRHFLLSKCDSVALLAGLVIPMSVEQQDYIKYLANRLPSAIVLNVDSGKRLIDCIPGNFPQYAPHEISPFLSLAHVGVILSMEEGACYASAEYLLSGLPIVSTRSFGGREVFFNSDYVQFVSPTTHSVYKAIETLKLKHISPDLIRAATLRKMQPHRNRFFNWLGETYLQFGVEQDVAKLWPHIFINKMIRYAQPFPSQFLHDISIQPTWK